MIVNKNNFRQWFLLVNLNLFDELLTEGDVGVYLKPQKPKEK